MALCRKHFFIDLELKLCMTILYTDRRLGLMTTAIWFGIPYLDIKSIPITFAIEIPQVRGHVLYL